MSDTYNCWQKLIEGFFIFEDDIMR